MERLSNYVVRIYVPGDGDSSQYHQVTDVVPVARAAMKARGIRPKTYEQKTYPGHWPLYHEWTCTRGVFVTAYEIG
jgi:hypothetical protein